MRSVRDAAPEEALRRKPSAIDSSSPSRCALSAGHNRFSSKTALPTGFHGCINVFLEHAALPAGSRHAPPDIHALKFWQIPRRAGGAHRSGRSRRTRGRLPASGARRRGQRAAPRSLTAGGGSAPPACLRTPPRARSVSHMHCNYSCLLNVVLHGTAWAVAGSCCTS